MHADKKHRSGAGLQTCHPQSHHAARTRALVAALLLAAAAPAQTHRPAIDPAKVVDLTYTFDENTIYWPNAKPFRWQKDAWGVSPAGYWYTSASFCASEHQGTHLDSPIHFAEGQATAEAIPLSRLIAPAVLIDIRKQSAANRDYRLVTADIAAWEKVHGRIPEGSIVLVRTGWGKYWLNRKQYLGSDAPGDTSNLHFPGLSKEAAALLVRRKPAGVGIDTASLDHGPSKDFMVHRVLNAAGIYGLENVANLEQVPGSGATIIALPMKIKGGSGAPARIVAVLP